MFVDLFHPTQELYAKASRPLTINGIHLTAEGNRMLAEVIVKALFSRGAELFKRTPERFEKSARPCSTRTFTGSTAIARWTDIQSTVAGPTWRSWMARPIAWSIQREMEVLDVMTANRDRRIWAVAQGSGLKVDDDNTPPFIPVKTNKPGRGPGGAHVFLDGEASIKQMTIGKGLTSTSSPPRRSFPTWPSRCRCRSTPRAGCG